MVICNADSRVGSWSQPFEKSTPESEVGVGGRSWPFEKPTPESSGIVAVFHNSTLESGVRVVRFQVSTPETGVGVSLKFTDSAALVKT